MIIYFSATGNSKFVSQKIAEATNDVAVSVDMVSGKIVLKDGENLGIVTPTYFWGLPFHIDDFLKKLKIENGKNSYIYYVATYGTTPGQTDYFVNRHLKQKGLKLSASYSVKTVDNWTVWFDLSDKNKVQKILDKEKNQIENIVISVKNKKEEFIHKGKMPLWLCFGARCFYDSARRTKHLNVNDKCIACGLCEKECPVGAIKIIDKKPKWIKKKCVMCFKCLHNCPKFAIQYDNKTQKHGQYNHN